MTLTCTLHILLPKNTSQATLKNGELLNAEYQSAHLFNDEY